jgi:hypothetical protein
VPASLRHESALSYPRHQGRDHVLKPLPVCDFFQSACLLLKRRSVLVMG